MAFFKERERRGSTRRDSIQPDGSMGADWGAGHNAAALPPHSLTFSGMRDMKKIPIR